ncbi:MAG: hypothetical protein ABW202_00805 [Duganella sp.]
MSECIPCDLAECRAAVFCAVTALDDEVAAWLTTSAAWDQRTHPSIKQFLRDIREYAVALERGGKVSPNIIFATAIRLGAKVHDQAVDARLEALREALSHYAHALKQDC